jgi:signal recognition particle GTPase
VLEYRVTILVGHFGSGKTEIAINSALELAGRGEHVTLVDLDTVKPYFRCRALASRVAERDVRVVASDVEHAGLELPRISSDLHDVFARDDRRVIVDVGGDPVGALAIGAIADALPPGEVEHLLVLNFARPHTEAVAQAVAMARAIEAAARLPLTGLVANTNLMGETTLDALRDGLRLTGQAAAILNLPIAFAAVEERLVGALSSGWASCPVLPIRRLVFPPVVVPERPVALRTSPVIARRPLPPSHVVVARGTAPSPHLRAVKGA